MNTSTVDTSTVDTGPDPKSGVTRRTVLKGAGATLGLAAFGAAMSPLAKLKDQVSLDQFLQKHYTEMSKQDMADVIARHEADAKEEYGKDVTIANPRPVEGTKFGYAINLSLCNGNGKCAEACNKENNHDRASNQSYIRILELDKGSLALDSADSTYTHAVPADDKFYMPVQCMQCDSPPCVDVCPVEATWKEKDGIVVVDYDWCIGCRYCEAACPYHARRFNWKKAEIPSDEINPIQAYLSNRVRPPGVMEKCHFCLHRTRVGKVPACMEACPTGARVFGNLLDETSKLRWVLDNKRVFVLKESLGTKPCLFYFFDE